MPGYDLVLTGKSIQSCSLINGRHVTKSRVRKFVLHRLASNHIAATGTLLVHPCACNTQLPITETIVTYRKIVLPIFNDVYRALYFDPNFQHPPLRHGMAVVPVHENEYFVEVPHQRISCKLFDLPDGTVHIITHETKLQLVPLERIELLAHWHSVHTEPCPHPPYTYARTEHIEFTTGPDHVTFVDTPH
jgi:hypothetical protein